MTRNYWQIPDPNYIVSATSATRRKILAYAAANGIGVAEAIKRIVELAKI